eukprot:413385-Amphidinium_carterae.1
METRVQIQERVGDQSFSDAETKAFLSRKQHHEAKQESGIMHMIYVRVPQIFSKFTAKYNRRQPTAVATKA